MRQAADKLLSQTETLTMSPAEKNQGMAFRLAAAVADETSQALPSDAIVGAGLFAIAAALDRFTSLFEREFRAKRTSRHKTNAPT